MIKEKANQLKAKLNDIMEEIRTKTDIKRDISAEFVTRNITGNRGITGASLVFTNNLNVNTLTDSEEDIRFLFLFSLGLIKALEKAEITEYDIHLEDYFTKLEIEKWTDYKETKDEESIYPIVIPNVQEVVPGKIWQTVWSAPYLNSFDTSNLLIYNFMNQRDPKVTVYGERINVDMDKVNTIALRMENEKQFPDTIKLNVLHNMEDKVVYNPKNNTLTIYEGSVINIFDGYHRKTANSIVCEKTPNFNFNWSITITNLSEQDAHDYMVQIDKQKPIKKEYIQQRDYSKSENLCIDAIVDDRLSELAKVMKDSDDYIKLKKALTKKSIVASAINDKYEDQIKNTSNIRSVARWIVEFTDYLMGLYTNEFIINPYKVKETSMVNDKNMFYGYIALSAKLQNNKDWKNILKQKMDSIDFSKGNLIWREIGIIGDKDVNKSTKNKIYNLFERGL